MKCLAIVDEYYLQIYDYLTKMLNSDIVCEISGMCLSPGKALQVNIFLFSTHVSNVTAIYSY